MDNIIEENKECPFFNECNHVDCNKFCVKKYKCDYYFNEGFIPKDKRIKIPLVIDKDGRDEQSFIELSNIEKNIDEFVEEGKNLYIYSQNVGNGKTSWSFRLLRSYINKVWKINIFLD